MNNSAGGTTTTQQAPASQLPFQQYGMNQAYQQYQNAGSNPNQLVSPFSQQQNQAIGNITNLANSQTGPTQSAANYTQNVLNGSPANNPYLSSEFNLGANDVQNRLSSEFANSGRGVIGSLPIQADQMNNLATQLYGGAYNTGVQQQMQAAANAPNIASSQMATQQGLFGAGQQIQNLGQQYIQAPQTFLNNYLNQANQVPGTSIQTTGQGNPMLAAAGGATLGSSIGSTLGSLFSPQNPSASQWGSLLGSIGGGLLGGG